MNKSLEQSSAYELADELAFKHIAGDESGAFNSNLIVMLRQQADRIAELENELAFMEGDYPEPTIVEKMKEFANLEQALRKIAELEKQSEPSYFGLTNDHTWLSCDEKMYNKLKPTHRMKCYTTPQTKPEGYGKAVPLSDEEIQELANKYLYVFNNIPYADDITAFARAIEAKVRGQ